MNTENQLKSKLAWPVCPKNIKLKQKWYMSNDYSYKLSFYWVFGGGIKIWWGSLLEGISKFLVGGGGRDFSPTIPPVGKAVISVLINCFKACSQIKNISSIYLHHMCHYSSMFSKFFSWSAAIKRIACGGTNLVPVAVSCNCLKFISFIELKDVVL